MSEKPYRTIAGISLLWAFTSVAIAGSFTPAAGTTLSSTSVTVAWQSDAVQQWVRAYISSGDKIFDSGRQSSSTGQANFAIAPSVTQLRIVFYEKTTGGSWRPDDRTYTVNIDATEGGTNGGPLPPTNLRHAVYSSTAAEVFWDRATTFGLVYEILRDGVLLTTTDGTSYFDETLTGGQFYTYEILAIGQQGRRSASSLITLQTPGSEQSEPLSDINQENFKNILALAARLTTNTFDGGILKFVNIASKDSGTSDRDSFFSNEPPSVLSVVKECPLSGKVTIVETGFENFNDTYNECATPMSTINGTIVDNSDTSSAYIDVDLVFEDIEFNRFSPSSRTGNVVVRGNLDDLCTECTGGGRYTLHEYREEAAGNISLSLTGSGYSGGTVLGVDADPFADITLFSSADFQVTLSGYPGININTESLVLDMEITLDTEGFGVPGSRFEVVGSDGSKVSASFQGLVGRPDVQIKDNSGNNTSTGPGPDWFEIFRYPLERAAER